MATEQNKPGLADGQATERLIAGLTLFIGLASGCAALMLHRRDWAGGLALGAVLAWLNFRWLARGLDALVAASIGQAGPQTSSPEGSRAGTPTAVTGIAAESPEEGVREARPKAQVPLGTYFMGLFRYGLIGLCVYVIFTYLHVPLGSLIVGLCALGAATIAASVYEILRPAA
jgi:small-conductance mechanosensitive channel